MGLNRPRMWTRLFGRAVNPVEARRERDQSNGVVVLPRIYREAIVESLRLEVVEDPGECGRSLRESQFIVASDREIEANRAGRARRARLASLETTLSGLSAGLAATIR